MRDVQPDSKADDAGIRPGDVIVEAGGKSIATAEDLLRIVDGYSAPTPLVLLVKREQASLYLAVPLT